MTKTTSMDSRDPDGYWPNPTRYFSKDYIYTSAEGFVYDENYPQYNCFIPLFTGDFWCVDCWICDQHGNIHPDLVDGGVPVTSDQIGQTMKYRHSLIKSDKQ